jgi:putative ABC transport system permease protein
MTMLRVSLSGLWAHKRRLVGTVLAVFLGVAFLAGTMVLSATLSASIDGFFTRANSGTDVVVRNATAVSSAPGAQRGPIDAAIAERVRAVPGVAVALPVVQGFGQIVGHDGTAVSVNGPRVAQSWLADPALDPWRIAAGRAPRTDDEVVLDRASARLGGLHVGDRTTLLTPAPVPVTVVGIATFGTADAFGGSSYVGLTLSAARRYLVPPGTISSVSVKAQPGVAPEELVRRIAATLPSTVEAVTGARLTEEDIASVNSAFLSVFRGFLTVFAIVALLVATFSIHNTFAILVAARTRESGLLRAIGASRRQVLVTVVGEALAVGVLATAAGLAGGLGLAALLKKAFAGLGFDLPATGLVFTGATVAVCVPVGIVVTLVAAAVPAWRAGRVAPLAALLAAAVEPTRPSAVRVAAGTILAAGGAVVAVVLPNAAAAQLGSALAFIGVVVLGPVTARLVTAGLGVPVAALRGVTGQLARRNAMRNPRRTASASIALLIGVGVVALFTVFGASLQTSTVDSLGAAFTGDLALSASQFGNGGMSPHLAADLARLPEVRAATGIGAGRVLLDGTSVDVHVVDPATVAAVVRVDRAVAALGDRQVAVAQTVAQQRSWHVGTVVPVRYGDGAVDALTIGAVYPANPLLGDYLLPERTWRTHTPQYLHATVYVAASGDLSRARQAVTAVAARYGAPTVRDRQQLFDATAQGIAQLLNVVYVLLALAVLIALMGIANTLSLAVNERTREIGLLRAVGATRRQVRAMLRWESVLTALFGTLTGLGVGVFLGWVLVRASGTGGFTAPAVPLVAIAAGGALAGLLAGLLPARRAARLPLLTAIAVE